MKKTKALVGIIVALSLILCASYSYAESDKQNIEKKEFFYLSKDSVAVGDKAEMNIDLEKIIYDKFILEIKSSDKLDNVTGSNINNQEIIKDDNEIIMDIDKAASRVDIIKLQYFISDEKKAGDKIKFVATITKKVVDETGSTDNEIDNDEKGEIIDNENNNANTAEQQSVTVELTIVEKNTNDKNEQEGENNKPDREENSSNKKPDNNKDNSSGKPNKDQGNNGGNLNMFEGNKGGKTGKNSNNSLTFGQNGMQNMQMYDGNISKNNIEKVVYNGSDNNYLKKLSIKDYGLNTKFRKEKATYFIEVDADVKKLNVTAEAESSLAEVCIYGNKELEAGINKMLINVTAENGNVRTYRIYVTKET